MQLTKEQKRSFYQLLFPALIEAVLVRLFHIVDSMMVGQMEGSTIAVAAVGLCGAPVNLIISVTSGFFIGTTATIAWHFGAKQKRQARNVTYQSMTIAFGIAVVFTALSLFGAEPIIRFVCGSNAAYEAAVTYYRINAYGFFFQILTLNITAAFRGVGISKLPMVYNLIGGGINVLFNYLLIFGKMGFPAMGLEGAAWATVISKIIAFLIALGALLWKKSPIQFQKGISWKWERSIRVRLLPIGLTAAGEQALLQTGAMISTKLIAGMSTAHVAANSVVNSIEAFAWSTGSACNTASTSLFGRALGAGDEGLGKRFVRLTIRWAMLFAAAEMLVMCCFGTPLARLFTNDSSLYPVIVRIMFIGAATLPFINGHQTFSGALRSAGDTVAPLIASFVSLWLFRVLCGYLVIDVLEWGIYAYRACQMLDQATRCIIVLIFYYKGHWKRHLSKTA